MADYCVLQEDCYKLHLSRFIERPWTLMVPFYIGDVPSGMGTPDGYCAIECNSEPDFLINIYGSSSFGNQATFWHSWLVLNSTSSVHFISIETREIASFDFGEFCSLYPAEDYLFACSISDVLCFSREAQMLWRTNNIGWDGVEITSVQGDRVLGSAGRSMGVENWPWTPFVLSLATGQVINNV